MRSSSVVAPGTRSDIPMPRLSKRISRVNSPRRSQYATEDGQLPADIQVRVGALRVDEIDRAVAHDSVRDVDVAAPGKAHFGHA